MTELRLRAGGLSQLFSKRTWIPSAGSPNYHTVMSTSARHNAEQG